MYLPISSKMESWVKKARRTDQAMGGEGFRGQGIERGRGCRGRIKRLTIQE